MNSLVPYDTPVTRLLVNNLLILAIIWVADYLLFRNQDVEKMINYDRLDLLEESKRSELEADLEIRFGITQIRKIQVGNIDTLKGQVKIKIWIQDRQHLHFED
jgi:hypothetical protein